MLHLTDEKDDLESVCRYRYQTHAHRELRDYMGRVLDANPDKRAFVGGSRPSAHQGYIPLTPNTFIWLPNKDVDSVDPFVAQDYQTACIHMNYSSPMKRFKFRRLLKNTRIDLALAASQARVHIEQASLYLHHAANKAVNDLHHAANKAVNELKAYETEEKASVWSSVDHSLEHIGKEARELHEAISEFTKGLFEFSAYLDSATEAELKEHISASYARMIRKYTASMRVAGRYAKASTRLIISRNLFHAYDSVNEGPFWETSPFSLDHLTKIMRYTKSITRGMLVVELASDFYEVYKTYEEHGDWGKKLIDIGAEIVGGIAFTGLAALLLPETLVGAVIAGAIGGVAGVKAGKFTDRIDFKQILATHVQESHPWIR